VLDELPRLARHRYADTGGTVHGASEERDWFVTVAGMMLALLAPPDQILDRALALTWLFVDPAFIGHEAGGYLASIVERAEKAQAGIRTMFDGKPCVPVYIPSRQWIVDRLAVTAAEVDALGLRAIATHSQAKTRKRRAQGVQPRADYEATAAARRLQAVQAVEVLGMSKKAAARAIGISAFELRRFLKTAGPG
jgi:hypothetical protein